MKDIHYDTEVIRHLAEVNFCMSVAAGHKKRAEEAFNAAKKMILSGKSTGDLLRDYIIVTAGEDSEKLIEVLRSTEALLTGEIGELILFTYTWSENMLKHVIDPGIFGQIILKRVFLSTLRKTELIINPQKETCDFPTEKLVEGGDDGLFYAEELTPGNLCLKDLLRKERSFKYLDGIVLHWEFEIGSVAIANWVVENPRWRKCVLEIAGGLGKSKDLDIS